MSNAQRKADNEIEPLPITMTEEDFVDDLEEIALSVPVTARKELGDLREMIVQRGGKVPKEMLTDHQRDAVLRLIPRVIVHKIEDRVPDGFKLKTIAFNGDVSTKVFGIGVQGSVNAVFEREDPD